MVTIKEIAEKTGVSPTTVANVLHGKLHKVSPETAQRVRSALHEMHYIPNIRARLLAQNGSCLIGVMIHYPVREEKTVVQDPFHAELIGAMERSIREMGYFTMLYAAQSAEEILAAAASWSLDGLVVLGLAQEQCRTLCGGTQAPVVFVDCGTEDCVSVRSDDYAGGLEMTRFLIQKGHRFISFLADSNPPRGVDLERLRGFESAMAQAGLAGCMEFLPLSQSLAQRQEIFCRLGKGLAPRTALFFASDYYAAEAITLFEGLGLRIPADISVAGFDDSDAVRFLRPRLTTVRQNVSQKGETAVKKLLALMEHGHVSPMQTRLPVEIVERDSVGLPQEWETAQEHGK